MGRVREEGWAGEEALETDSILYSHVGNQSATF